MTNPETLMAARLVCEAAEHCGDNPTANVHGMTINRPDENVLQKAQSLVTTHESGADTSKASRAFQEALREWSK